MEKRFFLAFFLTLCVMVLYLHVAGRYAAPKSEANTIAETQPLPQVASNEPKNSNSSVAIPESQQVKTITIGKFDITYSPRGGYIKKIYSKAYEQDLSFQNIGFVPAQKEIEFTDTFEKNQLVFQNKTLRKTYIFDANRLQIVFSSGPVDSVVLFSNPLGTNSLNTRYQEFFYKTAATMERKTIQNIIPQPSFLGRVFQGQLPPPDISVSGAKFAGVRDRYFCLALLEGNYSLKWAQNPQTKETFLILPKTATIAMYLGLQNKEDLQLVGLQEVIYYGSFHGVGVIIFKILNFFFFVTQNWGVAVILFGILTYLLLFPFTKKSTQAMKEMREFQEDHAVEMKNIREKHKDNPQKMHQEIMRVYQQNNFSPLKGCTSGCLPLLVQLPIIWAFWAVAPRILEFKNAHFLWIRDLSSADQLFHFPFVLPLGLGANFNLLPIATAALMFFQMKITNPPTDPEQAQQQKMMGMIMPVMLIFFLYNLPAALLLYWFVQSLLTFTFQWKTMRPKAA